MSDKKQEVVSTHDKKEKFRSPQEIIRSDPRFKKLYEAVVQQKVKDFTNHITTLNSEEKKKKKGESPPGIQIIQIVLHDAIAGNIDITPFLQLDCMKEKKALLKDLIIYAVKHGKHESIVPIAKALKKLGLGVDEIAINLNTKPPEPLINGSIKTPNNYKTTLQLLQCGSKTHTTDGLISAQIGVRHNDEATLFPGSLETAINYHDPENNDQSAVISHMISTASLKDISESVDLLKVFLLNQKDSDFLIMKQLLDKSENPLQTALELLQKTQNKEGYTNKELLREYILTRIDSEKNKSIWRKTGPGYMELAQSIREQSIISKLREAKVPIPKPGFLENVYNTFFGSSRSTIGESKAEPLLPFDAQRDHSVSYGSTDPDAYTPPRPGFGINSDPDKL